MAIDAATLFTGLAATYEAAFANNPTLRAFAHQIAETVRPNGRILDIGCGTGRPFADILAAAGHSVHGIDISPDMVRVAQSQVPGRFEVCDMKGFRPSEPYDGVCAILSLFQHTPGELYSLIFRFAEWVRVGGYVAIGVTPSTGLNWEDRCTYDPTWDCVWMMDKPFMGKKTDEVFLSEGGWERLLRAAGLVVEMKPVSALFCPAESGGPETRPEVQYYILARKVEQEPLLGPYPIPVSMPLGGQTAGGPSAKMANPFTNHLVSRDLESFMKDLTNKSTGDTLAIGDEHSLGRFIHRGRRIQYFPERPDNKPLPYASHAFQTILVPWLLDQVVDIAASIQNFVRLADRHDSQIIILQGAPGNETTTHLNAVTRSPHIVHQGHILRTAAQHLENGGFGDITFLRVSAHYAFPEEDLLARCAFAADSLVDIWYREHPQDRVIRKALASRLKLHFRGRGREVGNDMVVLIAKPFSAMAKNGRC